MTVNGQLFLPDALFSGPDFPGGGLLLCETDPRGRKRGDVFTNCTGTHRLRDFASDSADWIAHLSCGR